MKGRHNVMMGFVCLILQTMPVLGQHNESPPVEYLGTWGERGKAPGAFRDPQAISVGSAGFIYIADTGNQRIQKWTSGGVYVSQIGGFGWGKEQFDRPVDISARNGLDVFVADHYNNRIERYDKDLHFLASFVSSEQWSEDLRFGFPMGVDISSQGELFLLESENDRVLKLDILGTPQRSFGDFDTGAGRLTDPQRLLVTPQGVVFVTDLEPASIVVFDIHGNWTDRMGNGELLRPCGLASSDPDLLFVADAGANQVVIFRKRDLIYRIDGSRSAGFRFEEPVDVTLWRDRILILDRKMCAIHVFRMTGLLEKLGG